MDCKTKCIPDENSSALVCPHRLRNSSQILVADAEKYIREFISDILCEMGFEVVGAASCIEGYNRFMGRGFDLVFTNSKIICRDGYSLAYHIKTRSPDTPLVMLVGRNTRNPLDKNEGCCMD
jgi:CheY-like chemotaxis protein